ncbi:MAG: hypothetical protein K6F99_11065 [Lachnospiraceae bacterium]|nr:hypothetical protein [Lachnospiraceae bacterium]
MFTSINAIEGIDAEEAIAAIGDEDIYTEVVKVYYEDGETKLKEIEKALKDTEYQLYTVYVHGLKSASKSIGAFELAEKFKALEMAGKSFEFDYITENNDAVIEEYKKLLSALGNIFGSQAAADDGEDMQKKFDDYTKELDRALNLKNAAKAGEIVEKMQNEGFTDFVFSSLEEIMDEAEAGNFDDATDLLDDLKMAGEFSSLW